MDPAVKVIEATHGPLSGQLFPIEEESTLIGRDGDCDIQLVESAASRKHALLSVEENGRVILRDLGSRNGTWVAGRRIEEVTLRDGDKLGFGESGFTYLARVDIDPNDSAQLRLLSGPARETTVGGFNSAKSQELQAAVRAAKAMREEMARQTIEWCCASPLGRRAREEGLERCPACGKEIRR
jgi:hypothetical protein